MNNLTDVVTLLTTEYTKLNGELTELKRLVNQAVLADLGPYLAHELAAASASMGTSEPDEGIAAFLEKRPPDFSGSHHG